MHIRETRQRTSVCKRRRNFVKAASCAAAARAAALVKNAKRARPRAAERLCAAPTGSARGESSATRTRPPRSGYNKTADPAAPRRCPSAAVCREPSIRRQYTKRTRGSKPHIRTSRCGRRRTRCSAVGDPFMRRTRRNADCKPHRLDALTEHRKLLRGAGRKYALGCPQRSGI